MMTDHLSLKDAKAQGVKRYYTGAPCPRGHLCERMVSTRACIDCLYERRTLWRDANPEKVSETSREWRLANPDKVRASKAVAHRRDPKPQAERSRRWHVANREKVNEASARWRKKNPETVAAAQARRRSRVLGQLAPWADNAKIEKFYAEARRISKETGIEHHVDHVVPLAGKLVSGLHCENNLQILPATVNKRKSNHFPI